MKVALGALSVILGIAVLSAPVAHADDNDTLFLTTIKNHLFGITNTNGDAGADRAWPRSVPGIGERPQPRVHA